ncbi:MAG: putative immunity protein, partial [Pseudomonadota bacterium]
MTMNRDTITIDEVLALGLCNSWTRERLQTLAGGRESMSALEVCGLDVPPQDIFWLLLREPILTAVELRLLAARWAERVLTIYERFQPGDDRPRQANASARLFALGRATTAELDAAWDAAWAAASAAASAAAVAAASAAASAAAWAAA